MFRNIQFIVLGYIISVFLSISLSAAENVKEPASKQKTRELVDKAAIIRQLEQIPKILQNGIAQAQRKAQKKVSEPALNDLYHAIQKSFDSQKLQKKIEEHIAKKMSNEDVDFVMNWLNSPLGEKILKLEDSVSTAEAYEEMQKRKEELSKDSKRVDQIYKLDQAIQGSKTNLELGINMQFAMAAAMAAVYDPENREILDNILKKVEANRPRMEGPIKESTMTSYLYMYRDLETDEIEQYIAFVKSEPGQKYFNALLESLSSAIMDAARNTGPALTEIIKEKKKEQQNNP